MKKIIAHTVDKSSDNRRQKMKIVWYFILIMFLPGGSQMIKQHSHSLCRPARYGYFLITTKDILRHLSFQVNNQNERVRTTKSCL